MCKNPVCAEYVPTTGYVQICGMWHDMCQYVASLDMCQYVMKDFVRVCVYVVMLTIRELTKDYVTLGVYHGRVYVQHRRRMVVGSFAYQYDPLRYIDFRHEPIH